MTRYFLGLALISLLSACSPKTTAGVATGATQQAKPSLAPTANDTSLLWRINGPGLTEESFLYGTIHLIPEEDYFLDNKVIAAINDADAVVFEIDPRQMQDPMMIMSLMSKINMRGGKSLADLLTAEEYQTVEDYFTGQGVPSMMFNIFKKMKPLFLSSMVGQELGSMMPGGDGKPSGTKSYEFEMTELAEAAEKEISGLETLEFQLGLFDSIPYPAQAKMLYEAVVDAANATDGVPDKFQEMVSMYKRKAVAEMATMITDETADVARFEELLLTTRNKNWIPRIQEMSAKGPRLYAVGAGHLGGNLGVIALLRVAGFTVEPVY